MKAKIESETMEIFEYTINTCQHFPLSRSVDVSNAQFVKYLSKSLV